MLTKTLEIKNHKIHLDMTLPDYFTSKRVKITIEQEEEIVLSPIKKLRGKLNFSDEQYQEIQKFLKEDR